MKWRLVLGIVLVFLTSEIHADFSGSEYVPDFQCKFKVDLVICNWTIIEDVKSFPGGAVYQLKLTYPSPDYWALDRKTKTDTSTRTTTQDSFVFTMNDYPDMERGKDYRVHIALARKDLSSIIGHTETWFNIPEEQGTTAIPDEEISSVVPGTNVNSNSDEKITSGFVTADESSM
eukprot:379655_1